VFVVNVASFDDYMLIDSYFAFCFLLFAMTTLLQLGISHRNLNICLNWSQAPILLTWHAQCN